MLGLLFCSGVKLFGQLFCEAYRECYWDVVLPYFSILVLWQAPEIPLKDDDGEICYYEGWKATATIHGDGEQSRDFTYVENVVEANLKAAAAPAEKVAGRMFNCACGQPYTLNQTYKLIAELTGYKNPPKYGPPREGDIKHSYVDIPAARERLALTLKLGFWRGCSARWSGIANSVRNTRGRQSAQERNPGG